ncbi:MAG: GTPase Era [Hyphomicrobiales bacterium]
MGHKAGFVNIIGKPNVGKSTLMNALVGEKLSIITSKAQTTRHRIMGLVNGEDFQLIYSDTPGIVDPSYKLHQSMMQFVKTALLDADVILLVIDINDKDTNFNYLEKIKKTKIPVIVAINKIDVSEQSKVVEVIEKWQSLIPDASVIPVSALEKFNVTTIFDELINKIPVNPPYFPKDELTDKPMRFFISEIIREKILLNYKKEIPYSVEIEVESYKETQDMIKIYSIIYVARESQKGIIIGHQGKALKKVGTEARKDIEEFVGKKVFLETRVKVLKDWRDNDKQLKRFGYLY